MLTCSYPNLSPSDVPCSVLGGAAGSSSLAISSPRQVAVLPAVSRVAVGFPSPNHPFLSVPGTPSPSRVTTEVLSPRGNYVTLGVLVPLGNSTPPPAPWHPPPGFSGSLEASSPPYPSPTSEDLPVFLPTGYPIPVPSLRIIAAAFSRYVRFLGGCIRCGASISCCTP